MKLLSERIAEDIKNMVIEEKFKVGDKLPNELELSKLMLVSRATIREAIKILVASNILEVRRGKGTFVSEQLGISKDPLGLVFENDKKKLIYDLFETRLMIEPELVGMVCKRATENDVEIITKLANEIESLIINGKEHVEKDKEFHSAIARASKNSVVTKIIPMINDSINFGYDATKNDEEVNQSVIRIHREIVEAIREKNIEKAKKATIEHIKIAMKKISL
ncbi:MAG: FadR/GntR family transcriptional regulator [Sarcina sp.]